MLKPQDEVVVHMFMFSLSHVGRCGFFKLLFFHFTLSKYGHHCILHAVLFRKG